MRKGQAAMEFLMTYGWAILVVLAAIGALAYFGVLSPDRFLPDKCTISPPFSCTEYKITESDLQLGVQNNAGVGMSEVTVSVVGDCTAVYTTSGTTGNGDMVGGGQLNNSVFSSDCVLGAGKAGNKFKANILIEYQKDGEGVKHNTTGTIQARIE